MSVATFSSCFLLLLLLLLLLLIPLLRWQAAAPIVKPFPAANPLAGSMGFRSYIRQFLGAILMLFRPSLPYFSETHRKNNCSYLFLLFPAAAAAAAAPAPATPEAGCDAKNRITPSSKSPWQ